MYGRGEEGQDYVLGARMETKDQSLDNDIDGTNFGVDCGQEVGDMVYCVKP
jgi:hypothetical protein